MGKIRIGTSGWTYAHWRGRFYPADLPQRRELEYAAGMFTSLEVNGSFYGMIRHATWRNWRDSVPGGFKFAVKGSRFITHNKKLGDIRTPLANFFASGILELGKTLGPILWQVPASMRFNADRVEEFFAQLPQRTDAAVELAGQHDSRVEDHPPPQSGNHRIRHAFEFRNRTFMTDDMVRIARRHGVALAFSHSSQWPYVEQLTAGFVYLRLHGPRNLYASRYGDSLDEWAVRIRAWSNGHLPKDSQVFSSLRPPYRKTRDVYVYFDNDHLAYATDEAAQLRDILG